MKVTKYTPHAPSRAAIRQVKDPLPIPTKCDECGGGPVEIRQNSDVYNGRLLGEWPWIFLCVNCLAYVGMHPYTNIPLGSLAGEELRRNRVAAKTPFNLILKAGIYTRTEAYKVLASHLGIPLEQCHFGMMDRNLCLKSQSWANEILRCIK